MKLIASRLAIMLLAACCAAAAAQAQTGAGGQRAPVVTDEGWPRKFASGPNSFSVYQPQVERWEGNRFEARAAVAVAEGQTNQTAYGVIWFAARTEVDKVNRLVTMTDFRITKVNFPTAPDRAARYQELLQQRVPAAGQLIALDRLLSDMALARAEDRDAGHQLRNDPPQIFFSTRPAILVLIDGAPVLRPVAGTGLRRVINTRVLLVRDEAEGKFYLHLMDGWLEADSVEGPWAVARQTPDGLKQALQSAGAGRQVDLLDGSAAGAASPKPSVKEAAAADAVPTVYVSTEPAELLQAHGELQAAAVGGTSLLYVVNTENDIFLDTSTGAHYVLISGRWFRAPSLKGPWEYVPGAGLPADFARIPPAHPKADVLVSVPGTPQAREALIANQIPQTATIARGATRLTVVYDGRPQFKAIEGTPLLYAVNTPTPVIAVEGRGYFAVQDGVWFVAAAPEGPWAVADSVPAVVYTIPPSSPVHYVTYVKVYGATPEAVYVGYTPGYYGTVVSSEKVVVYGAGWTYPPYIGAYWYGVPWTYGYGVGFAWSVTGGWALAYGVGYAWSDYYYPAPWYGSVTWGRAGYGWGGAAANVYGTWGNVAYAGTLAAWANPHTGNYGRGGAVSGVNTATGTRFNGRAGINTNVYTGTTVARAGGVAYNPNTGRVAAGQAGAVTNAYTGNGAAGARGVSYNPQTGVIHGGAAGAVRNGATGQTAAGAGGFAYNTRTGTGVAVGNNNVYAGRDGNVYRYNQSGGLQQHTSGGWQSVNRPADARSFQNLQSARGTGQMRWDNFRASGGGGRFAGGGGRRFAGGGGFRGGGRRR
ncbi:MAG TPA: hypothetical protein VG148_10115 [Pyrinomonadaceae bacterium]|nr:hypothetical protein [Pyrinomonadaceae bacterium]